MPPLGMPLFLVPVLLLLRLLLSATFENFVVGAVKWKHQRWHHELRTLPQESMERISQAVHQHHHDFNTTLDAILMERVPGTTGNHLVRQHIKASLQSLGWLVEEDAFVAETPHGTKPFVNVIGTHDPGACRRLVLACHYDSKYISSGVFLGATDSAVPCTMMLQLARALNPALQARKQTTKTLSDLTLQLVFFDGEEAFEKWSSSDSLYGSRHLAAMWGNMPYKKERCGSKENLLSQLDRIDVFVLLDLLGAADPKIKSYFPDTLPLYENLVSIEQRFNDLGLLDVPARSRETKPRTRYFQNRSSFSLVEDDHIPFMKRGVPILHVIPVPFPPVWHLLSDNRENLHHPTISNLNKIFQTFVAEYLHLDV